VTVRESEFWDFSVFYSSARAALQGQTIYRTYGSRHLPYWYFPWVAWAFVPLSLLPFETAKLVYVVLTVGSAASVVYFGSHLFNPKTPISSQIFILGISLLMSWLLFRTGQLDFILAAVVLGVILLIHRRQDIAAGLLFPLLLFKPHLLAVFIPFSFVRGGKRYIASALASVVVLSALAFVLIPNWPAQMVRMLQEYGGRTDNIWHFATFAELIGRTENWSGTANLWITGALFLIGFAAAWKSQHLRTASFLAFTLAASMLCAPRAYSYNLPFLLPALLWVTVGSTDLTILIWTAVGIVAVAAQFSTGTYVIVLLTFVLGMMQAHRLAAVERATG
jgi:hypothetical protein